MASRYTWSFAASPLWPDLRRHPLWWNWLQAAEFESLGSADFRHVLVRNHLWIMLGHCRPSCDFFFTTHSLECIVPEITRVFGWWFGTWLLFFHILGMSSSQLTHSIIFQRGGSTTRYHWNVMRTKFTLTMRSTITRWPHHYPQVPSHLA